MKIDGIEYGCAEQYMMASKARLFGDDEALAFIMATQNPFEQKLLGRTVRGFDVVAWEKVARDIVYVGNYHKFTQNSEFLEMLLATEDREIVEASPTDRIWGIGLGENDPRALNKAQWRGRNWLGEAIMRVRATIRKERT